jgi:hypothetical protein
MRGWKVSMLCLALAMTAFAMLGGSASAAHSKGHKHKAHPRKVRILSKGQTQIGRKGVVVKVRSSRAGRVRLNGFSTTFDVGRKRFTRKVVVRFKKRGVKRVRLPLTAAGRKSVKSCTARTIEVWSGKSRTRFAMTRNARNCRLPEIPMENAENCDFIAEPGNALCMLPFPDDYYTTPDASSETGLHVNFKTAGMPANGFGTHIDAAPYAASNGFSQGETILVKIPGIETVADVNAMGAVPVSDIGRYEEKNTPVVVIDTKTGKRWPIWTEIDSTAKDQSKRVLEIHPAVNFESGGRYIVALRNVHNAAGKKIEAPAAFRYYRDEMPSHQGKVNARRKHFKELFSKLKKAGIARESLYLAWDFTTATDMNNARRALALRNDAFAQLGDTNLSDGVVQGASPKFEVTSVTVPKAGEEEGVARRVKGTITVPCYLYPSCANGGTFQKFGANEAPAQNGTWAANFDCIVPESVTEGAGGQARPALYGHGLFGSASEVGSTPQRKLAQAHKIVMCATNEIGMSEEDQGPLLGILNNLSGFPKVADRLQQGLLDELYLGRAMIAPGGFGSNKAFSTDGEEGSPSVIDPSHLYYNGNSQGGIEGGALTALSPDFTRASLGVPAMNYSVLLPRSVDFDEFAAVLYPAYPNETVRPLALDLIQMLWDRGEPNGYAHRMTGEPLPGTPSHQILLDVALGDHQVTDYQAEVEARTVGVQAHQPALYNGRWPGMSTLWNIPTISAYPYTGSAIYYWDAGPARAGEGGKTIGTEPPPFENLPNRTGEDPHGLPREAAAEQQLVSHFFEGAIQQSDNCGGGPCYAGTFTGP